VYSESEQHTKSEVKTSDYTFTIRRRQRQEIKQQHQQNKIGRYRKKKSDKVDLSDNIIVLTDRAGTAEIYGRE